MTIFDKVLRLGRRQLHVVTSSKIVKPFSPSPSHLKTYNLTLLDQTISFNTFIPIVIFYSRGGNYHSSYEKTLDLKNSLSKILTQYYPFAGRFTKTAAAHVDCSDEGVEFLEASIESTLTDFLRNSKHKDLYQFFPHGQIWYNSDRKSDSKQVIPVAIQINHFKCGGVAVAASISHKLADASSLFHFINDWAKTTRFGSSVPDHVEPSSSNPQFISFPYRNIIFDSFTRQGSKDIVTKRFLFHNSMINQLKLKVIAMTGESKQPIEKPTRVEVLTWLLYKCAVEATTKNNLGKLKPTTCYSPINIRGRMMEPLSEKSIGNYLMLMEITTKNEREMNPGSFLSELKKEKIKFQGIKDIEACFGLLPNTSSKSALEEYQKKLDGGFFITSVCGYPAYEIDFGWGKPVKVTIPPGDIMNFIILMDTPNRDGIEVLVNLEKKDMDIFQSNPELHTYC